MSKIIDIQSPTRVDLAGGTLDMWPLYSFLGSALTVNVAIDIWTRARVETRPDQKVMIHSLDLKKEWQFENLQDLFTSQDQALNLFQKILKQYSNFTSGFKLTTSSESPIGGGLGGSSSLVISILKAMDQMLNIYDRTTRDMVYLAHNIEAEVLKTPTGTQDYYPAATGGLSFIEYTPTGISQKIMDVSNTPFMDHFLLVYTGKSHHSGLNNFEVLKAAVEGNKNVLSALEKIQKISLQLKKTIEEKKWSQLPELFKEEYKARIQLTPAFTSPEIETLSRVCIEAGALAVKICGAGGGGCVLVWVSPQQRERVMQVCQKEKFQCLNAKPINLVQLPS